MKRKAAIVTGSSGLIGSQTVKFLIDKGYYIVGIDNDMRSYFFGKEASTKESEEKMLSDYGRENFNPVNIDIRDYDGLENVFKYLTTDLTENVKTLLDNPVEFDFDMVVHAAAQPSHDWAAKEPLTDFSVNAIGTMNMLELTRLYAPKATFIFTSTNKVYGDTPNRLNLIELPTRYEAYIEINGGELQEIEVSERMSIDHTKHSIFGASKVAADVMVQEYGRYFGMNTVVFRGGCLTGPNHAGAELHGFLSYLMKCIVNEKPYTIFGYKGKQVRDNIHSWDLVNMFWHYHQNPKPGAVYNAGGGRENSTSILEAIDKANEILINKGIKSKAWNNYKIDPQNRIGDHQWYISDLSKFQEDYPQWPGITISLDETILQILDEEVSQLPETISQL